MIESKIEGPVVVGGASAEIGSVELFVGEVLSALLVFTSQSEKVHSSPSTESLS